MEQQPPIRKTGSRRCAWHGTALVLETLLLLFFLALFVVVLVKLQAGTHTMGSESTLVSSAVMLAANDAETFAAEPTAAPEVLSYRMVDGSLTQASHDDADALVVSRSVHAEERVGGTLYLAEICVTQKDKPIYELSTSRYVSNQEVIAQ